MGLRYPRCRFDSYREHKKMKKILLIHGVFRNPKFLIPLAERLRKDGYIVETFSYPFMPKSFHLFENFIKKVEEFRPDTIIGHSTGGNIAVRQINQIQDYVKRIICIGSPLASSSVSKKMAKSVLSPFLSKAARDMLHTPIVIPGNNKIPVGVLVGTDNRDGKNNLFKGYEGGGDGTVSIEETKIENTSDRHEIYASHVELPFNDEAFEKIINFIERESFN